MMTSPNGSPLAPSASERVPLRILLDDGKPSGPLDGAWWPQSRDLQVEGADLIDHFPDVVGRVERLLYSPPDWDAGHGRSGTHAIAATRGTVKVGSFPGDDTHVMVLKMASGRRVRLLVVPWATEPSAAARLMEQAAEDGNIFPASTLLDRAAD